MACNRASTLTGRGHGIKATDRCANIDLRKYIQFQPTPNRGQTERRHENDCIPASLRPHRSCILPPAVLCRAPRSTRRNPFRIHARTLPRNILSKRDGAERTRAEHPHGRVVFLR